VGRVQELLVAQPAEGAALSDTRSTRSRKATWWSRPESLDGEAFDQAPTT
jgi:hypothetical protein